MAGVGDLSGLAMILVVATLLLAFGALILENVQTSLDPDGMAYNITGEGLTVLWTVVGFVGIVAVVSIAGIIIKTLLGSFSGGSSNAM